MKRFSTKIVSVWAVIAFVSAPAMGQKQVETFARSMNGELPAMQLRAGAAQPDSAITYAATGEKSSKTLYTYSAGKLVEELTLDWVNGQWVNATKITYEYGYDARGDTKKEVYNWEAGKWVDETENGYYIIDPPVSAVSYRESSIRWPSPVAGYGGTVFGFTEDTWEWLAYKAVPGYENGNLTSVEFHVYERANPDNSSLAYRYTIAYNAGGQPVSIAGYNGDNGDNLFLTVEYQYDLNGNIIFYYYEESNTYVRYTSVNGIIATEEKNWEGALTRSVSQTDGNGNVYRTQYYTFTANKWYLTHYTIYYPNTLTPSVEIGNNNPVGGDNRGGFDIDITVSANSIAGGSFVVKLPDGFTLDESNTGLAIDFNDFELAITRQENNSWLLKLNSRNTRSAILLSSEAGKTLAHVAYTVDDKVKHGMYDITVHSILFETPSGDAIVEPAITLSATLNRWSTGNETVNTSPPLAWSYNGIIHIRSGYPQQVAIYSLSGVKLYEISVPAGTITINATHFQKGVYIVAFGNNARQKVPVY
jgi:hypothetical protein